MLNTADRTAGRACCMQKFVCVDVVLSNASMRNLSLNAVAYPFMNNMRSIDISLLVYRLTALYLSAAEMHWQLYKCADKCMLEIPATAVRM